MSMYNGMHTPPTNNMAGKIKFGGRFYHKPWHNFYLLYLNSLPGCNAKRPGFARLAT